MDLVTHEYGPYSDRSGTRTYMAKLITGAGDDDTVIYVNGDPFDNRRHNLRIVPTAELRPAGSARRRPPRRSRTRARAER